MRHQRKEVPQANGPPRRPGSGANLWRAPSLTRLWARETESARGMPWARAQGTWMPPHHTRGPSNISEEEPLPPPRGRHRSLWTDVAVIWGTFRDRPTNRQRRPQTLILSIINSTQKNAFLYIISPPDMLCGPEISFYNFYNDGA